MSETIPLVECNLVAGPMDGETVYTPYYLPEIRVDLVPLPLPGVETPPRECLVYKLIGGGAYLFHHREES